jgi:hypothetical protein
MGDFDPNIGSRTGRRDVQRTRLPPASPGTGNTAVGTGTLALTIGKNNTAFGSNVLSLNTTGINNTGIGTSVLVSNTTGIDNCAFGVNALQNNTTGQQNVAIGRQTLQNNLTGIVNAALGDQALRNNTAGNNNMGIGRGTLSSNSTGNNNTAIGGGCLGVLNGGSNNVAIGSTVASVTLTTGSNNILIGTSNAVDTPLSSTSNWLNIGGAIVGSLTGTINYLASSTNDNSAAGCIGEYVSSTVLVGAAVSLTSGASANITSISLTAGDWDVNATVAFSPNGTAAQTICQAGVSTTTGTLPTAPGGGAYIAVPVNLITGDGSCFPVGTTRLSLSSTTTVYLVANTTFTGVAATVGGYGFIGARRAR